MPWFIKTETFTNEMMGLVPAKRKKYLEEHREWVDKLRSSGLNIASGYLIDDYQKPGGGGLLVVEMDTFESAKTLIKNDPLIISRLVNWRIEEWIPVCGKLLE